MKNGTLIAAALAGLFSAAALGACSKEEKTEKKAPARQMDKGVPAAGNQTAKPQAPAAGSQAGNAQPPAAGSQTGGPQPPAAGSQAAPAGDAGTRP